jgi:Ca2+-binding EF-hand superfamily protein
MIFSVLDADKQGKITFKNLKRISHELGEHFSDKELREMIAEVDADGDGGV